MQFTSMPLNNWLLNCKKDIYKLLVMPYALFRFHGLIHTVFFCHNFGANVFPVHSLFLGESLSSLKFLDVLVLMSTEQYLAFFPFKVILGTYL